MNAQLKYKIPVMNPRKIQDNKFTPVFALKRLMAMKKVEINREKIFSFKKKKSTNSKLWKTLRLFIKAFLCIYGEYKKTS